MISHANYLALQVIGCAIDQADYPVQVYFYKGSQLIHQLSGVRGEVRESSPGTRLAQVWHKSGASLAQVLHTSD